MGSEGYSGYTNYETWVTMLWLNNDGSDEYWKEQVRYCDDANELAHQLESHHDEAIDERTDGQGLPGFAQDILNAGLRRINWLEIAEEIWAETHEDDEDEEETEETKEDEEDAE